MLHVKFHGNRSTGSGEQDFKGVLTIYGHGSHLGQVTQMPRTILVPPYSWRLHAKFGFDWPSDFGEDVRSYGRTTDAGAWLYYKLTYKHEPILDIFRLLPIVIESFTYQAKVTLKVTEVAMEGK